MRRVFCVLWFCFLAACGGGGDTSVPVPFSSAMHCGVSVGTQRITGSVSSVHDGDSLTVNGQSIRLAGVDAPELSQAHGLVARDHLADRVLGQRVTVAYSHTDAYDRVVGRVFNAGCTQINLAQVRAGDAWYYEAYQCEMDLSQRMAFAAAQAAAQSSAQGLWAAPAVAPWIYRNGVDAKVPATCPNGDLPSF
jgi:endonuclease YncB( thermonuclease family)